MFGRIHRRRWLVAALTVPCLAHRRARAIGEDGEFDVRLVRYDGGNPRPHETAPRRLAWELRRRTSIEPTLEPTEARFDDPALFSTPFVLWAGDRAFPAMSAAERQGLARFVQHGGMIVSDDAEPDVGAFTESVLRELRAALPASTVSPLPADHTVYHSYYLLDRPEGRVEGPPTLDALRVGERVAVVLSRHDLGGAWARDVYGRWTHSVTPGGDAQRERAIRLGVNLAMYALCLDYKDDQVHAPFIMRRRRGAP